MGIWAVEGDSPLHVFICTDSGILSRAGHEESCLNLRGPSRKAKYNRRPIVYQYCEGKVKSTPDRGVKQNLKPYAYKLSEPDFDSVTACLLHNEPTSYCC